MTLARRPEPLRERWTALCARIGRGDGGTLFNLLESQYSHPPRAYHSLEHVSACLTLLDGCRGLALHADELEFAIWVHDCVYTPQRTDNEERSAAVARLFLRELGAAGEIADRVTRLIMATRHTGQPETGDAALIADIDLAILGSSEADYDRYALGIRAEYSFAPDAEYRHGRTAFLQALLKRPAIYFTSAFSERFEQLSRANIKRELIALSCA